MNRQIRRADLVQGGTVIKQGDTFTLGFQLFNSEGNIVTPTAGQTIEVKLANRENVIFETEATVNGNTIEFSVNEDIGFGEIRAEIKVTDGSGLIQKYPAEGWITLKITPSLDNVKVGGIITYTAELMLSKMDESNAKAEAAEVTAAQVRSEMQAIIDEATPSDAMSRQAAFNAAGVDKGNLKDRLDEDYNEVTAQLAQKATREELNQTVGNIAEGTPLFASSTAGMTDSSRLYVNTTNGLIYRYDGVNFVSTGVQYQSTGVADGSISKIKLDATVDYERSVVGSNKVFSVEEWEEAAGFLVSSGWQKISFEENTQLLVGENLLTVKVTESPSNYYRLMSLYTPADSLYKKYKKISLAITYRATGTGVIQVLQQHKENGVIKKDTTNVLKMDGLEHSEVIEFTYDNQSALTAFYIQLQGGNINDVVEISYIDVWFGNRNDNPFEKYLLKKEILATVDEKLAAPENIENGYDAYQNILTGGIYL